MLLGAGPHASPKRSSRVCQSMSEVPLHGGVRCDTVQVQGFCLQGGALRGVCADKQITSSVAKNIVQAGHESVG